MAMRSSVSAAWPEHCERFEGQLTWMYLDTKLKVTTGTGNLIDTIAAAQAAGPWYKKDGTRASAAEVATEWRRVKALTSLAKQSGWAYQSSARLNLKTARVRELFRTTTAKFWSELVRRWPVIDNAPADAQLAALDLAWQNGYRFLDLKQPDGSWTWPNMRAAWLKADWAKAATAVPGTGARADSRKRLFRNASTVIRLGLDKGRLWDDQTPKETDVILFPGETPYVSRAKVPYYRDGKLIGYTCSCVAKSLPMVEMYMLMQGLIQQNIDIAQLGWRGDVDASAGTHDEGGCADTWGQWSTAHIDAWRLCGWTMQRRDLAGVDTHAHGWPYGCPHLAPAAVLQKNDWDRRDAGLQGSGQVVGRWPIDDWQTAYTKRMREIMAFADDIAAKTAANLDARFTKIEKLLAGVPAAVWAADVIPNAGLTSNTKNETLAAKSALVEVFREIQAARGQVGVVDEKVVGVDEKVGAVADQVVVIAEVAEQVRPAAAPTNQPTPDDEQGQ